MSGSGSRRALHVAVVGAGLMGRHHVAAIARAGGILSAVVDRRLEHARSIAGAAPAFTSLEELAARMGQIDVIHICTPPGSHVELVEHALALGAHVVVEKPVAPNGAATQALLAAASARRLTLTPVHQFLFQPGVQRLLAARHRLGTLVRCTFHATSAGAEIIGIGPDELVADVLPHPLALFSRLAPVPVSDLQWSATRPQPGELRAISADDGATYEIVISTRVRPTRAELEVFGTRASARADLFHGFALVEQGAVTPIRKATRPFEVAGATFTRAGANLAARASRGETAYPGLRELVRLTYRSIVAGSPPPISSKETLAVALARDAILRGAAAPAPARTPP
jgi:predicted dehydrogenase